MATHFQPPAARPSRCLPAHRAARWLISGGIAVAALAWAGGASAQSFLANKKFEDTEVTANSSTTLTFDLFNSRAENLNATLADTLPVTTPPGQLWFSPADVAAVIQGSATPAGCTTGTVTFSDYLDAPANTRARTITITDAVVPPRPSGTVQPNCQVAIPVHTGAVSTDENVTNSVPGTAATARNAANEVFQSNDFSATLRILAPVNPLPTTKAFAPALVAGGGQSTLTITVRNNTRNPQVALSGVTFTDTLPTGLTTVGAPTFENCGSPSTTTGANATSVQMSGGSIAIGATCTVRVQVTAPNTTEALVNTIAAGGVTATGGYSNAVPAQATLNVRSEIKMTKAFGNNGATSNWRTVDQPVPPTLYSGVTFNTNNATANVNQPVPVRVYFSNPTTTELTGGTINDTLPGNTVAVGGTVAGTCGNLPAAPIAAGATAVSITGFTVPAAVNGQPSSCYIQFYVKTTATMNPAENALSTGPGGNVTFANTNATTFPTQATAARLVTTAEGPGPGYGRVRTDKAFTTANGTSYRGSDLNQAAHVNKGEQFWMRVAALNTTYDVDYENGSIVDHLPPGLRVVTPVQVRVMQNPPAPFGNGQATTTPHGCSVPGSVSVSGSAITYSGWTLLNAAGPNNASPRNLGCFYNILLESDGTADANGIDAINRILASDVSATRVGGGGTVTAEGDVAARVIVRSDLDTTKSFSPATLPMGEGAVTRLTIAFSNKAVSPITGLAVTDPLPANASFGTLRVANPPNINNTCGGTPTAAAGADSVSLAGGTVPGGSVTAPGTCQIQVDVVRTGGTVGNASITNVIATGAVTNAQAKATWSRSPPPSARAATWASTWSRASRKAAPWAAAQCR